MKKIIQLYLASLVALTTFAAGLTNLAAAQTNTAVARIGVYDSRAVAYAWFSSARHHRQLNELIQTARDAQAVGDTNRFKELAATLRWQQDEIHRESFSTAPPKEALAEIKGRLPEIQKAAGVSMLVSKGTTRP